MTTRDSELEARILEAVRRQPPPRTRKQQLALDAVLLIAGFAVAFGVFMLYGGFREYMGHAPKPSEGPTRSPLLIALTFGGTLALAAATFRLGYQRVGSMIGRSRQTLAVMIVGVPVALFLWKVGVSYPFEGAVEWWATRPGLKCFGLSLLMALSILVGMVLTRRSSDPVHPYFTGAALGLAAGSAAAVMADLWCPVGNPEHVLIGHVLPVIVFTILGAFPFGLLIDMRFERRG
jgi:hypothetical protein